MIWLESGPLEFPQTIEEMRFESSTATQNREWLTCVTRDSTAASAKTLFRNKYLSILSLISLAMNGRMFNMPTKSVID
jgi:hypothetical protein